MQDNIAHDLDGQGQALGLDVSRETLDRLHRYAALLVKWNPAINLVSKASLTQLWQRHIADSAQIFALAPQGARHWADLGSGGGFPGLVVAILAAEHAPDMRVSLVESDARKAAFLAAAARETGVQPQIHSARIEALPPLQADVLSARALAALPALCGFAERHLAAGGLALFPKGAQYAIEIAEARKFWRFDLAQSPSKTDTEAVILEIRGLTRAA